MNLGNKKSLENFERIGEKGLNVFTEFGMCKFDKIKIKLRFRSCANTIKSDTIALALWLKTKFEKINAEKVANLLKDHWKKFDKKLIAIERQQNIEKRNSFINRRVKRVNEGELGVVFLIFGLLLFAAPYMITSLPALIIIAVIAGILMILTRNV